MVQYHPLSPTNRTSLDYRMSLPEFPADAAGQLIHALCSSMIVVIIDPLTITFPVHRQFATVVFVPF